MDHNNTKTSEEESFHSPSIFYNRGLNIVKTFFGKLDRLQQAEFWTATVILMLSLMIRYANSDTELDYQLLFLPTFWRSVILYGAFLLLNFKVVPSLFRKENILLNSFYLLLVFLFVTWTNDLIHDFVVTVLEENNASPDRVYYIVHHPFYVILWSIGVFTSYTILKYAWRYLTSDRNDVQSVRYILIRDSFAVFVVWLVIIALLAIAEAEVGIAVAWGVMIPMSLLVYVYGFKFAIPKSLDKKRPFLSYGWRVFLFAGLISFSMALIVAILSDEGELALSLGFVNFFFQMIVSAPLSWLLFQRYQKNNEQLYTLKKELGHSEASIDFLRSQINPHFLFNALNTIYGTAIQEKAERTGEGILKLSDMMRFMLQENMQEKISLSREIDYLTNYIAIQRLRTDSNPIVHIQTNIEEVKNGFQIAPMLLIPFVENAFKHGISFREASYINVGLEIKEKVLYFDVHNSKHAKNESDPEKDKSGIGLNNVKQRLELLYTGKYDLMIRETGKDFFVHLTLQLS